MAKEETRGLEFISDEERAYFEEARLGDNARTFLVSDVGRYLHGRAKIQFAEATVAMVHCKPDELSDLQWKAQQAEQFMRWLTEAISNGDAAYHQLKEYRDA